MPRNPHKIILTVISVIAVCLITFSVVSILTTNKKQQKIVTSTANINRKIDNQNIRLNQSMITFNKVNITQSAQDQKDYEKLHQFFNRMFTYRNGKTYIQNRNSNLQLINKQKISTKQLAKVYATGLDSDGHNMIDNLHSKSKVKSIALYTLNSTRSNPLKTINALINYQGTIAGNPGMHNQTQWYQIVYNSTTSKIQFLKKLGNVSI